MTFHVKDGATWKEPNEIWVKDGATWKEAQELWVKDGATWKLAYSKAPSGDSQTVTTGGQGMAGNLTRLRGFSTSVGSIDDGTSDLYGGAAIQELYWYENGGVPLIRLTIQGSNIPNSGWETMDINTGFTVLNRANATYNQAAGSATWTWNGAPAFAAQPFDSIGSLIPVVFA